MIPKRTFLFAYLLLAIAYSLISILDSILNLSANCLCVYQTQIALISALFFATTIIFILIFWYHRMHKLAFLLPAYHITMSTLFFLTGSIFALNGSFSQYVINVFLYIGIFLGLIELALAMYVLRKYRLL
jgi:hypothetical protein